MVASAIGFANSLEAIIILCLFVLFVVILYEKTLMVQDSLQLNQSMCFKWKAHWFNWSKCCWHQREAWSLDYCVWLLGIPEEDVFFFLIGVEWRCSWIRTWPCNVVGKCFEEEVFVLLFFEIFYILHRVEKLGR